MTEYIERENAIAWFMPYAHVGESIDANIVISDIKGIKAADVAPVRHAYWVPEERVDRISAAVTYRNTRYLCSACGRALVAWEKPIDAPYCHCGAKMDGKPEVAHEDCNAERV